MADMNEIFGDGAAPVAEDQKKAQKKALSQETKAAMKTALKETLASDPTFEEKVSALSDSIEMVHSLGYSGKKSLVLDKEAYEKNGHVRNEQTLIPVPSIVGYQFKNNSDQTIPYTTEVFTLNEATGNYEGQVVEKSWAPGEVITLSRKYMAVNFSRVEFSFTLKNGVVVTAFRGAKSVDEQLQNCYFKLAEGTDYEINDDNVKIAIDVDKVVKDEFKETFGYLMNTKTRASKGSTKSNLTTQALTANYVQSLIKKQQG